MPAFSLTGTGPKARLRRFGQGLENPTIARRAAPVKRLIDVDPEIAKVLRLETERQATKRELCAAFPLYRERLLP